MSPQTMTLYRYRIVERKTRQWWGTAWAESSGHARRLIARDQSNGTHCRRSKHGFTASKMEPEQTRDNGLGSIIWY